MLNWFAKIVLISSAMSPILGAVAVSLLASKGWRLQGLIWLAIAAMLIGLCLIVLWQASTRGELHTVQIAEYESNDKEVLAFLLAYCLPLISSENLAFKSTWIPGAYFLAITFLAVLHSKSLHFNPMMGLFGYHFYGIKDDNGVSQILITRVELRQNRQKIKVVMLADHIYLQKKEA